MKNIVLLGSTGSIGTQVLEVVRASSDLKIVGLSRHRNTELLNKQIEEFKPEIVGEATELAAYQSADLVVNATLGFAGLEPTLAAVGAGKNVALANKESLVVGGSIVMAEAKKHSVQIIPIDSEHSAIFQCLQNVRGQGSGVKRVVLTCSGGPLRGKNKKDLEHVTVEQALAHPKWNMGKKISIDSATLMNKGLEIIEARWLFNLKPEQIDVVIHPESIVHSFVEFVDGSVLAQLGVPDMKLPIHYALHYPERVLSIAPPLEITALKQLTFEKPDEETFECLALAKEALQVGGTMPAVLNAANEAAVELFLQKKVGFLDIPRLVKVAMERHHAILTPSLEDIHAADAEGRSFVSRS